MFVVIEGPNGVGKSSAVQSAAAAFEARGLAVLSTTEPTSSALGTLLRHAGDDIPGRALALGIAADRWLHLENEILPATRAGQLVISDRYVQSSLVLQRFDHISPDDVWKYNDFVVAPDLSIYLRDEADKIAARVKQRARISRMERIGTTELELLYYGDAYEFLAAQGWHQEEIDCRNQTLDQITDRVVELIDDLLGLAYK